MWKRTTIYNAPREVSVEKNIDLLRKWPKVATLTSTVCQAMCTHCSVHLIVYNTI